MSKERDQTLVALRNCYDMLKQLSRQSKNLTSGGADPAVTVVTLERGVDTALAQLEFNAPVLASQPPRPGYASGLREIRERRELSQATVAAALGVSQPSYSNLERGIVKPTADVAVQLSRMLKCSVEDVLGMTNPFDDIT